MTETHDSQAYMVARVFRTAASIVPEQAEHIAQSLLEAAGVVEVHVGPGFSRVQVTYDVSRIDFSRIEHILTDCGFPPPGNWRQRVRRAWYGFVDENVRDNAPSSSGNCCSQPTNIYASRKRHE